MMNPLTESEKDMTETQTTQAANPMLLSLDNELGVEAAGDIQTRLMEALTASDSVTIDLSGATEVSLPLMQLLYAAGLSAERQGKKVALQGLENEVVARLLALAGFDRLTGAEPLGGKKDLGGYGGKP